MMQAASKRGGGKLEFPGASQYMDRHGKLRWRLRRAGSSVNLGTEYGRADFIRRYNAAMGLQDPPSTRSIRAVAGSLG